ncbi:hypothetical protein [Nodularia spumigena]|uniref:hypothetical protein n=1 Tax=Nodularia spumigena TaxID=70799 RepID=UPI002B1F3C6C|nr:hypothetical protein [Nodularia spumigena]MEA5559562.1 hypothetical protein [Nodularia spumigena CH309]
MKKNKTKLVAVFFSLLYCVYMLIIPWESITKSGGFIDYERYVVKYGSSLERIYFESSVEPNIKSLLVTEALWGYTMFFLADITQDSAFSLRLFSFIIAFILAYYTFQRVPIYFGLLFLMHPMCISIVMSIIRNGVAWSFLMVAFTMQHKIKKWIIIGLMPFVHASSVVVIGLYSYKIWFLDKIKTKVALINTILGVGVGVGLILTVANFVLNAFINDQRLEDDYSTTSGSWLQASFWIILIIVQFFSPFEYIKKHSLTILLLVWYITMNPFIPWSYRIWGIFIPLMALAIWELPQHFKIPIVVCWIGYTFVWYLNYFNI